MAPIYLGIETIIILRYDAVSIAANVMFKGLTYDQPVYTNIFCDYYELKWFLNLDKSKFGKKISAVVTETFVQNDGENIQIDLPLYLPGRLDWRFPVAVNLITAVTDDIPFPYYRFQP